MPREPLTPELAHWFIPHLFAGTRLSVQGVGVGQRMPPYLVESRASRTVLIAAFHGPVQLGVKGHLVRTAGPCVVAWVPPVALLYGDGESAWNHSWIHVDGAWPRQRLRALAIPPGRPIAGVAPEALEQAARIIHAESREPAPSAEIVERALDILLLRLARAANRPEAGAEVPPALLELRRWLDEHYAERLDLRRMAERCGWTPTHLCFRFKRAFGLPPLAYLTRQRLERGLSLLRGQRVPVAEAARLVGYGDARTFARILRRHTGRGPRALRAS